MSLVVNALSYSFKRNKNSFTQKQFQIKLFKYFLNIKFLSKINTINFTIYNQFHMLTNLDKMLEIIIKGTLINGDNLLRPH